jgi:aminoglycoside N3'-acetyltransferase
MISALFFTEKAAARRSSQPIHSCGQLGQHEDGSAEISLSREEAA